MQAIPQDCAQLILNGTESADFYGKCKQDLKVLIVQLKRLKTKFLPPAYVVRREGNSFTLFVCPHLGGGYPYPIMLCNISQNAMGQRGVPDQVPPSQGTPPRGGTRSATPPPRGGLPGQVPPPGGTLAGGTLVRNPPRGGTLAGGVPGQVPPGGVPWPGGTRSGTPSTRSGWGGTLAGGVGVPWPGGYPGWGGYPGQVPPPPGQVRMGGVPCWGGGTQVGQQKEYSLHGGRYASCVHAGGLSCYS